MDYQQPGAPSGCVGRGPDWSQARRRACSSARQRAARDHRHRALALARRPPRHQRAHQLLRGSVVTSAATQDDVRWPCRSDARDARRSSSLRRTTTTTRPTCAHGVAGEAGRTPGRWHRLDRHFGGRDGLPFVAVLRSLTPGCGRRPCREAILGRCQSKLSSSPSWRLHSPSCGIESFASAARTTSCGRSRR